MVSVSKEQKQQNAGNVVGKEPKTADAGLSAPKAQSYLQPDQANRPTEDANRLRAILNTKDVREVNTKNATKAPGSQRDPKQNKNHHNAHTVGGETFEHERSDRLAFRLVGAPGTKQNQIIRAKEKSKDPWSRTQGLPGEEQLPGHADKSHDVITSPLTSTANSQESSAAAQRFGEAKQEHSTGQVGSLDAGSASTADRSTAPKQEVVKLLDLVGPEAILTLKERLREVWVNLDNTAASDLDVIARMPASALGLSNSELLTVQSPQGVHFVAFLRNRNDFEVLQTFDRHALLPGDANKQLVEAAMMSYEQLGTICKEGAERMEGRVKKLGGQQPVDQVVFDGLRRQWVVAKRRGKKCGDLVEQLVDKIDQLELDEKLAEKNADIVAKPEEGPEEKEERIIKPEFERPILEVEDDGKPGGKGGK